MGVHWSSSPGRHVRPSETLRKLHTFYFRYGIGILPIEYGAPVLDAGKSNMLIVDRNHKLISTSINVLPPIVPLHMYEGDSKGIDVFVADFFEPIWEATFASRHALSFLMIAQDRTFACTTFPLRDPDGQVAGCMFVGKLAE